MRFIPVSTLILPILAFYGYVNGYITTDDQVSTINQIKLFIDKRCLENENPSAGEEAKEALDLFVSCWDIVLPSKQIFGNELYNYCIEQTENSSRRLDAFIEKLEPCLETREKYLKEFIVDGCRAYDQWSCKSISLTGSAKVEYSMCTETLENPLETHPLRACLMDSNVFNLSGNTTLRKQKVCNDFLTVETCCKTALNDYCPDSREIWDLFLHVFKEVLKNCYGPSD